MLTIEKINNLEKENEQLKEEIEIRTNLEERFRKEALKWADIANSYKKDLDKIEKLIDEIPYSLERLVELNCPCCNAPYETNARYELKIDVSQYTTDIGAQKRYKMYYECPKVSYGNRQRYIGDPTGLGYLTLTEALNDLKGYLNNDRM